MMERIYVTVRARPLSTEDAKSTPWRICGNSISQCSSSSNNSNKFDFDRIFKEDCNTKQVYEARTKDIVAAAVRGFNGTVFAYGQTNSGKTHTMRGSAVEPGVIPIAVRDLFHIIQEDANREFLLRMSYMEIYNEEINDLLAPEHRKLQIHENLERGIFVAGLREEIVATPEQVLDFMEFGESHRHIGETNMNVYSSRSHTIFRMIIESRVKSDDDVDTSCDAVRVSVLNLVDLAGSERAAKTGAEGMRLKEGSHINKSLMTLGTVIKKLSEAAESQGSHVPYRDSKLTRILQPSLGGNANTAIICNITLAQIHADETKSSLQFASRALRVTNCARVNEILTDAALLKRQKKEIEDLRARLQGSHAEHFEEEILSLRNTLLQSELERERIALELQEEKKAKALKERRLQEQAKEIENLSSMVLNSNADEKCFACKKTATTQLKDVFDTIWPECDMGLPPFQDLVLELVPSKDLISQDDSTLDEYCSNALLEDCILPDARSLLNVTNRKKALTKKNLLGNNSSVGILSVEQQNNESLDMQAEYEHLLVEFESQRIAKDIEIDCLTKKLAMDGYHSDGRNTGSLTCQLDGSTFYGDKSLTLRESEVILVKKQLQEKEKDFVPTMELLMDVKVIELDVQSLRTSIESIFAVTGELFQCFAVVSDMLLDLKIFVCQNGAQLKSITDNHQKIFTYMEKNIIELESDKSMLYKESINIQKQIEELRSKLHEAERVLTGEKAQAEREIKHLYGQKTLLERDICKRDSVAGRRCEVVLADRRCESKAFDSNKSKDVQFDQIVQGDYKKLEVLAFEMETTIVSLEEEVAAVNGEKEEALFKNGTLASELEAASNKLILVNSELKMLKDQLSSIKNLLAESESSCQKMKSSINLLQEEKEELAMQLAEALLEMDEEKAIWASKEKASLESISDKTKLSNAELMLLSKELSEVRHELDTCEKECKSLREKIAFSEDDVELERKRSHEKSSEVEQLRHALIIAKSDSEKCQNDLQGQLKVMLKERDRLSTQTEEQQKLKIEMESVKTNIEDFFLKARADEDQLKMRIASLETEKHNIAVNNNNEKAKLRMRLRSTQAKLDAFRGRYNEAADEIGFMNKKYEDASAKLKEQLASYGVEILQLKKLLAGRSE